MPGREGQDDMDVQDTIAAFADGEFVDPERLAGALSDAAGRDYLIDLLALRGLVSDGRVSRPAGPAVRVPVSVVRRRWLAIAAALTFAVVGGYETGRRTVESHREPVPAAATPVSIAPLAAPAPTRVIRLENGVDWNERAGGS